MERTRSDSSSSPSRLGTASMPAREASSLVRLLLPSRQDVTRSACSFKTRPTAWPISPGLSIATVSTDILIPLCPISTNKCRYEMFGNRLQGKVILRNRQTQTAYRDLNRLTYDSRNDR